MMYNNNGESHYQGNVPMAELTKHSETLRIENWGPLTSAMGANPTPTSVDLTNLYSSSC